jgi:hypothetical protein
MRLAKMNPFSDFIQIERDEYETQDGNLFAFSLGQASRYYDFISIIFERYEHVSESAVAVFSEIQRSLKSQAQSDGLLSAEQTYLFAQNAQKTIPAHLEIESFHLFAKILLDKIAFFLKDYFGEAKLSLISHHKLQKNLEQFRLAKNLIYPDGFSDSINFLQEHLVNFRDDEIAHKTNPRSVRGTTYNGNQVGITRVRIYPNERDNQVESKSLSELMLAIKRYIEQVIIVVEVNRSKSRFHLQEKRV